MVPSLPLVLGLAAATLAPVERFALPAMYALGRPRMPIVCLLDCSAFRLARIAESGIASIRPAPKTGVGMRKITLGLPLLPVTGSPFRPKSGWAMLQPAASFRPVITNRLCTPPSGVPSGLRWKRDSRVGPPAVTNHGMEFVAPLSVATAISGFIAGLVPPIAGCEWQDAHEFELKRGPRPLLLPPVTDSTSANRPRPS
jgi:hypothetical protein